MKHKSLDMNDQKSLDYLYSVDIDTLHLEAMRAADMHFTSVGYLLRIVEVAEDRALHEACELSSLYQYCTRLLNLSESISYELIAVVRKGREVPELKQAVLANRVTLSKAKKICSVINSVNHKEWIELAAEHTSRVIEKCVAGANPKECVQESAKYKTADRLEFKLGVSEEFMELLVAAKDLLSQKGSKAVGSEVALIASLKEFVEKHDPVRKAERAQKRAEKKARQEYGRKSKQKYQRVESVEIEVERAVKKPNLGALQFPGTVNESATQKKAEVEWSEMARGESSSKRERIVAHVLHQVRLRDRNQCTHVSQLGRCEQKRWLDVHHVVPVSRGGSNDLANLATLCSSHHRMTHLQH